MAVDHLNFGIDAGEIVGIQGVSGCGKTSAALAILKLLPPGAVVSGGIFFRGTNLLSLGESELRKIRGREISIIYQEPALALNPVMSVGTQIAEVLRAHMSVSSAQSRSHVNEILESVRLNPKRYYQKYPHELSGGERQRVLLAQAVICCPFLVIADEPTAGLDHTLRSEFLELVDHLRKKFGTAFLLISHDREVVSRVASKIVSLSGGSEAPTCRQVVNSLHGECNQLSTTQCQPLMRVRNLSKWYKARGLVRRKAAERHALDCVDFTVPARSLVGLVGPSGSGKSTLARCLALLETPDRGEIWFEENNVVGLKMRELRAYRPRLQYVPQNPAEALNPRLTAGEAIEEPLLIQKRGTAAERRERVYRVMHAVALDPASAHRSCHGFSGGQKQRIAIARALVLEPKLLILDESLSGLDPKTQHEILELLQKLKSSLGITQLLISHDIELVAAIADSVAVMRNGRIVEHESTLKIIENPAQWSREQVMQEAPRQELVLAEAE